MRLKFQYSEPCNADIRRPPLDFVNSFFMFPFIRDTKLSINIPISEFSCDIRQMTLSALGESAEP